MYRPCQLTPTSGGSEDHGIAIDTYSVAILEPERAIDTDLRSKLSPQSTVTYHVMQNAERTVQLF